MEEIAVRPGSRCAAALTITQVVPDSCQLKPHGVCPDDLVVQELFHGLPRGC